MKLRIAAYLVTILIVAGSTSAQRLPLGEWQLISHQFAGEQYEPLEKTVTLVVRSGGKLGGSTGCNSYGGKYRFDHGKLKISDIILTMMYCDELSNKFETLYTSTLRSATRIKFADGQLKIIDPTTSNFLIFEKVRTD